MSRKTYRVVWVNTLTGKMHRQTYRTANEIGNLAATLAQAVRDRNHLLAGVAQILEITEVV